MAVLECCVKIRRYQRVKITVKVKYTFRSLNPEIF